MPLAQRWLTGLHPRSTPEPGKHRHRAYLAHVKAAKMLGMLGPAGCLGPGWWTAGYSGRREGRDQEAAASQQAWWPWWEEGGSRQLAPQADLTVCQCQDGGQRMDALRILPVSSLAPPRRGPISDQPGSVWPRGGSPQLRRVTVGQRAPLSPTSHSWTPRSWSDLQQKQSKQTALLLCVFW